MNTTYFDRAGGWVTPTDDCESNTNVGLQTVVTALKAGEKGFEVSSRIFDAVEQLLYKYSIFIRQGIREKIGTHKAISWYLTDSPTDARAFISYQDDPAGEWLNDCYADEVPLWLLIFLFRRIARRKPLGDAEADETIKTVQRADLDYTEYKEKRESEATRWLKLSTMPHRLNAGGGHGRG